MGSCSLAAMAIFESKYREGLTRDEGIKLVSEAICTGIFNDLGSGSNVDFCVITKGRTEYLRNHQLPNPRTYVSSRDYSFTKGQTGMLPPFTLQSEETRALARYCTTRIEVGISAERLILLDTQPFFSPSILAEMIRPDGLSSVSVLNGESLSANLAHKLMGIQVMIVEISPLPVNDLYFLEELCT